MNIVGFGNPVYDLISTPKLRTTERVLSGCSTNACLALSKLGVQVTLVGTIGEDYRKRLENELEHYQIKKSIYTSRQTGGFSLYYYDEYGNRELQILGVADPLPNSVPADVYKYADFILIGPILGETTVELVNELHNNSKAPIFLDPQGLLRRQRNGIVDHGLTDDFIEIARKCEVIKANELETQIITGINPRLEPKKASEALRKFGCNIAVVTMAEAGSAIFDGNNFFMIPPFKTDAIDPTGAGDTYAAGFMLKYLEAPDNLKAVGCFASAVASVMVENSGPEFLLTRLEVDNRMKSLLLD